MSRNHSDEHLDNLNDTLGLDIRHMTTLLHKIKPGSKIYGEKLALHSEDAKERVIVFDHLDGMYSYCEVEELNGTPTLGKDGSIAIIHLSASTPLVAYKDGYRIYKGAHADSI